MENIELVIKIPEEIQLALINGIQLSIDQQSISDSVIKQAIINGIQLPKGHGRLVDISQIDKDKIESSNPVISLMVDDEYIEAVSLDYLNGLQAIIDAESEEENGQCEEM
jgi:hypothetical protein